jgi:DNA-binding transcriptional MocR family regulator
MALKEAVCAAAFARRVEALGTENAFKIGPRIREVEQSGRRVIRCNIGEPDFALPKHIAEEVKRQIDLDQTHYVDPQGIEPLRIAIARTVAEKRGLKITPDRVVVFPGAKPPIGFAQEVYCDPGDEVVYPSPGFPIYESFINYLGAVPKPLHLLEENGFTFRAHEAGFRVGTCAEIALIHASAGNFGSDWARYAERFAVKHRTALAGRVAARSWPMAAIKVATKEEIARSFPLATLREITARVRAGTPAR